MPYRNQSIKSSFLFQISSKVKKTRFYGAPDYLRDGVVNVGWVKIGITACFQTLNYYDVGNTDEAGGSGDGGQQSAKWQQSVRVPGEIRSSCVWCLVKSGNLSARTSTTAGAASLRKQRSRSSSRPQDEKPKKKKTTSVSLVSIPNTIKLSMLNSGLISFGNYILFISSFSL